MAAKDEADTGFELEAMCKEDSSWHPCEVSLSLAGVGLMICFESNESEDLVLDNEEALECLRFRSAPLQGDDCSRIEEGDRVLANYKSKRGSLFYDADVEKVLRVRHSKKVYCRCTFVIKWLHQDLNGETLTVPSASIMKLATKSINLHPTVDEFLKTIKNIDSPCSSPFSAVFKDIDDELDLNMLLDKQIEQITNSADASKGTRGDILLGFKVDIKGRVCSKTSSSHVKGHNDQNHIRRSTRSSRQLPVDMKVEDPPAPAPAPTIQEKDEYKSQLSPLAARAALASLMSTTTTVTAMAGTKLSDFFIGNEMSVETKLSSRMPMKECRTENVTSELANCGASLAPSATKRKLSQVTRTTRVTRSTIQKGAGFCEEKEILTVRTEQELEANLSTPITNLDFSEGNATVQNINLSEKRGSVSKKKKTVSSPLDAEINTPSEQGNKKWMSNAVESTQQTNGYADKLMSSRASTNRRRLTRSAVHEEKEILTKEVEQEPEENLSTPITNSDFSEGNAAASRSNLSEKRRTVLTKKKPVSSSLDVKINSPSEQGLEENLSTPITNRDLSEENVPVPNSNLSEKGSSVSKRKKLAPSLPEAEINAVGTTQQTEGKSSSIGTSSQSQKRKSVSSQKQEQRFSPRLRFLPRTRSQNK